MDGTEDSGTEIGKFCGRRNPGTLYSTTNVVTVIFRSDRSAQYIGFLMSWTAVNANDAPDIPTPTPSGRYNFLFINLMSKTEAIFEGPGI